MKCRTSTEYANQDLRTENQWAKDKKIPIVRDSGIMLWSNQFCSDAYMYYTPEQVRDMTMDELAEIKKKNHDKYIRQQERRKETEIQKKGEEIAYRHEYAEMRVESEVYVRCKPIGLELMKMAAQQPAEPCDNPSKIIVVDTETTGLDINEDEILQISIIDGGGNVLIDEYVKPYWSVRWDDAEQINGITPGMVKNSLYAHELIPRVKGIIQSADLVIGYNNVFDLGMLEKWGIRLVPEQKQYDVMLEFAHIYGEYDEWHGDYKWQKLITCAAYYGYKPSGDFHDSLEDVRATLFCYHRMQERNITVSNEKIADDYEPER